MIEGQKRKRCELETRFRPRKNGILHAFGELLDEIVRLDSRTGTASIQLYTDRKKEYQTAVAQLFSYYRGVA